MLQAIVGWSIQNRVVVVALSALLLVLGLVAAGGASLDVFPEFVPPQVVVQTEAPGLAADEVEPLVTLPLEQALNGLPGLDVLRSQSVQGLSVLTLIFRDGTDIYRDRQLVAERLAEVSGQLPGEVKPPRLGPLTSSTGRLLNLGFTSRTLSPIALRDWAQWTLRPRLLAVRGVAQVTLFGGGVREFQVQVRPESLIAHHLTLDDVLEATRQATGVRGAGFQENDEQRSVLRVEAQVRTASDLGAGVVATSGGNPVRLRDVARVVEAPEPKFGDAAIDGVPGVSLDVFKQFGGDTVAVTRAVEAELDRLRPEMKRRGIAYHGALFRQADFIDRAIGNVTRALLLGAALVAAVLFVFLFNARTALISLTAIPLSLLGAILALRVLGVSLNTLTLGGLAIAVGEVVDDAIIDVENIFRRLRENARLGHPRSAAAVVLAASLEVRSAVVYATFIVVLVFVPVFLLTGLQGRLFAPLGYAYALAVLASLAVALVVTPALALILLPHARGAEEPPLLRRLQGGYERLLRRLDRELALVATALVLMVAAAAWALRDFGGEFLPELRENHFNVHMHGIPGTSLPRSIAEGGAVSRELMRLPGVVGASQQAGRAELGDDTWGVEYSELEVRLKDLGAEDFERTERAIKATLRDRFPGLSFEVFSFLTERIQETISGSVAPVAVKVNGDDLGDLDRATRAIAAALDAVPGRDNVRAEPQAGQPEIVVRLRPEDAARHNVRAARVLDAVHAAYQGAHVAQAYDRNRIIDVVVILDPATRNDPDAVADLWIAAPPSLSATASTSEPGGDRLQLRQVADVFLADGRFFIRHEGGVRQQHVTAGVRGRDVESFVADAERQVAKLKLPPGVTYAFTGAHEVKRAAQRELLLLGSAAGAGILLILWMAFGSPRSLLLILANLPFALVGGVAVVYMTGGVLNVGSLVGFVTLFGITTRNGIMMVAHWRHLHDVEGVPWGTDLVIRGAGERLAPVLMTALVTALGLLPIALSVGQPGSEIEGPMALVILGGLVTSTGLNLLGLPVLYRHFGVARGGRERSGPADPGA
ncbi:MAG TPA: efflux RND transporter permease subunit [Isosphaeraceae bacterium]|jgi:CzcA family heavy metal efflux pump|nr:efflux RND transporter permease subunit [Isosphaeraceae bacterium]